MGCMGRACCAHDAIARDKTKEKWIEPGGNPLERSPTPTPLGHRKSANANTNANAALGHRKSTTNATCHLAGERAPMPTPTPLGALLSHFHACHATFGGQRWFARQRSTGPKLNRSQSSHFQMPPSRLDFILECVDSRHVVVGSQSSHFHAHHAAFGGQR
jgi:hypothetical protein